MVTSNQDSKDILAVDMRQITKRFGAVIANDNITFSVKKGEIHAILGENGAGKTTLMNILYGLLKPDSGEIYINGSLARIKNPNDAISLGIGMVHQHFMLVQPFTVAENLILGMEPRKCFGSIDMKKARQNVVELSEKYGLEINPDAKISDISVGMQQRVEILKSLYRGADILILDEPTASLTPQEISELIRIMRSLAESGKTIIIITHKLKEIKMIADRCTVMRQGQYTGTVNTSDVSLQDMADMMVGRQVSFKTPKKEFQPGEEILAIHDLHVLDYRGVEALKGLDLVVRQGEIMGLAGVDGNGQTELADVLTGMRKVEKGSITIRGKHIENCTPRQIFDSGLSCIPADRQRYGAILDLSVAENLVIQNIDTPPYSKKGTLNFHSILSHAEKQVESFDIRPSDCAGKPVGTLSGGNQQKVIVAREVLNGKDLLVAVNPTRGLDVGAIEYVHKYLVAHRDKGNAVLLISFELDEILNLADTIGVIYDGKISGSLSCRDADEQTLGFMMTGGNLSGKN